MKTNLAGISVGKGFPVRVLGVINVSPESFYKGSVPKNERALAETAQRMERDGADFLDIGAMSSAPYLNVRMSETEEARRLSWAVRIVKKCSALPISIDSYRARAAQAGMDAGGRIVNDIMGLLGERAMGGVARWADGVILMAHPDSVGPHPRSLSGKRRGMTVVKDILTRSLKEATRNKISLEKIVLDPGIGFFRNQGMPWWQWDLEVLRGMRELRRLRCPLLIGVSRKSFIGEVLKEKNPEKRLAGSLAATAVAVLNGAAIIRTHDVKETVDAIRMAEQLRG